MKPVSTDSQPESAVQTPAKAPNSLAIANDYGIAKVNKTPWQSFILAIFSGAFIAIAFVFYISVTTGSDAGWGLTRFIGGMAFSLGLMLVIAAGGELFTSTVLTTIGWVNKRITMKQQLQCWARVYLGNMVGALIMVALIMMGRLFELADGQWGLSALNIAQHKLHHTWTQAFVLGILCNILVCLGIWMTFATKDLLTKCIIVILPVAMFVAAGFEHCIANLFMLPFGIAVQNFAPDSFFTMIEMSRDQFADVNVTNAIFNNLIPVTLGNIVGGGIFIGLGYWLVENGSFSSFTSKEVLDPAVKPEAE
ncbi:formate transporter FocA [Shewanella gaetbuli]|uniref:Formate transporter FocA n=1 Tax=Shewanella gaetbuli TaxID=220752 RepID=A0A9X1ZJF4_9GAMM|nr:formate transporter FocA [Shewanella gaetbuli]MCL1143409.1 formate transporter FocA [Shewanella gaetbuli]